MRKEYGEPDVIRIRKTFDCPQKARIYEQKVLKRINAVKDDRFLNRTDNTSISLPNYVFAYKLSGEKYGFIRTTDSRLDCGELVRWGIQRDESGMTLWQKTGIKTRLRNSEIDIDTGLTRRELANIKRCKTVNKVLSNGNTLRELSIQKGLETRSKTVDQYGNNVFKQIGAKANITKQIIGEDGLTTHQRTNMKIKIKKYTIGDDGINGHKRQSNKARITCSTPNEDGITIYKKAALTRSKNQTHYNVYHITDGIKFENLSRSEVRNIHTSFFQHMNPETSFGSTKKSKHWLTKTGKLHLLGYYVMPIKKE